MVQTRSSSSIGEKTRSWSRKMKYLSRRAREMNFWRKREVNSMTEFRRNRMKRSKNEDKRNLIVTGPEPAEFVRAVRNGAVCCSSFGRFRCCPKVRPKHVGPCLSSLHWNFSVFFCIGIMNDPSNSGNINIPPESKLGLGWVIWLRITVVDGQTQAVHFHHFTNGHALSIEPWRSLPATLGPSISAVDFS